MILLRATLVVVSLMLAAAPPVRADDTSFLAAVRDAGFTQDDESIMRDGYMTCAVHMKLGDDMTVRVIWRVWMASGERFDDTKPALFLSLAKANLC